MMPYDGSQLDETTRALIAAREQIKRGWCQKVMRLGDKVCFIGAVRNVGANSEELWTRLAHAIDVELNIGSPGDLIPIRDWNDAEGRTKEEVLAAFDRAIGGSL